ncbi:ubiquitin-60S ribosomal protein l40 [Plakobranchus ocellatus]|uniref:Ubiquitin-60S ribosomal protein l40 n=1 Tax=Plakobranchus ocellatus TaxID=259542 RepID=A0AAV4CM10_9GAST|nr:ubiquitin-60S ribosomal protein l40 [Plakobranchus ocellatus]
MIAYFVSDISSARATLKEWNKRRLSWCGVQKFNARMNSDFLPSAQSLLSQRDGHKRLELGEYIHISGTKASFERGKPNVKVVLLRAGAAVTFYIYVGEVKLAASISSSSLQKAAANGIWITVVANHRHASMEVSRTPPVNTSSNVLAIIKLKGPEPKQELSSDGNEPEDEKVGFGNSYQIFVKRIDGKSETYDVTTNLTVVVLKQMIEQRSDLISFAEQRLLYGAKELENNMTLGHYGIKKDSTVHLLFRMVGG